MRSHNSPTNLIILGASARAAAFSAIRAGFRPWCADLFADADLQAACHVLRLNKNQYPNAFPRTGMEAPPGPWMFVGALENRPRLVRRMAQTRSLWGNDAEVLAKVRQPWLVADCLKRHGLAGPAVTRLSPPSRQSGRWLAKPLASCGGHGIHFWPSARLSSRVEGVYFQEYIEGMPCAAVYIATKSQVFLLGITRQLIGEPFLQAKQFQYCGSVGPLFPASENKERLELGTQEGGLKEPNSRRSKNAAGELDLSSSPLKPFILLGNALAKDFALRGLFGVDCVLCDGIPYPVEVNPRYTASVEVLELATGQSAVESHRLAFVPEGPGILPLSSLETESKFGKGENQHVVAKGVLFARDTFLVPSQCPWNASLDQPITGFRDFADIPHAGTRIDKGSPIVSIFARAKTVEQCLAALRVQAQRLDLRLFGR